MTILMLTTTLASLWMIYCYGLPLSMVISSVAGCGVHSAEAHVMEKSRFIQLFPEQPRSRCEAMGLSSATKNVLESVGKPKSEVPRSGPQGLGCWSPLTTKSSYFGLTLLPTCYCPMHAMSDNDLHGGTQCNMGSGNEVTVPISCIPRPIEGRRKGMVHTMCACVVNTENLYFWQFITP